MIVRFNLHLVSISVTLESMRLSPFAVVSRLTWVALAALPAWACATAVNSSAGDALQSDGGTGGDVTAGGGMKSATAGATGSAGGTSVGGSVNSAGASSAGASSAGTSSAFGGGSGIAGSAAGGAGAASGAAGHSGAASGGATGSAGMNGTAGKGGTTGSAGMNGTAGKGGATGSAGMTGAAGKGGATGSAGASSGGSAGAVSAGGATGGGTCNATTSLATIATSMVYTGTASDCVRLAINPGWSMVNLKLNSQPGTVGYPVSYSYSSCAGSGTGSLTKDYADSIILAGANPGCDVYVQFAGGSGAIKFTYYD
jgi:hypothetical protein